MRPRPSIFCLALLAGPLLRLALPLGAVAVGRWDTVQSQMFGWLGRDYLEGQLEWYAKNYRVIVIGSVRAWLPPPPPPAA